MKRKKILIIAMIFIIILASGGLALYILQSPQPQGDEPIKTYAEELAEVIERIKADQNWYAQVKKRAAGDPDCTLQERLIAEAEHVLKYS